MIEYIAKSDDIFISLITTYGYTTDERLCFCSYCILADNITYNFYNIFILKQNKMHLYTKFYCHFSHITKIILIVWMCNRLSESRGV